ncbi:MAG: peptidoglycan DD-metalloendopeptidase family protein [Bdellovibrionales bacterium]|nr:peptidoglycan DD-metalloendopeptidase family protein [Bdellovibrionales bacterium]
MQGLRIIAVLLLLLPSAVSAESRDVAKELAQVRGRIEREQERLETLRKHKEQSEQSIRGIQDDLHGLERSKEKLKDTLVQLERRARNIERGISISESKITEQRGLLEKRVVAIYKMQRRSGTLDYLMNAQSATELLKRASYLSRISSYDNRRLQELSKLIQEFQDEKSQLQKIKRQREQHLDQVIDLESQLEQKTLREANLLDEARREEAVRLETLKKLENSADKLERVLAKIMGSTEPEPPEVEPPEAETPEVSVVPEIKPEDTPKVDTQPFMGRGLASAQGSLPLPVDALLVQGFGKQRHGEFSDMLFVKGLEFKGDVGAKVRAVADGKVVLSQVLPGYGNVIIVDHGKRYYTLYGRLAGSLKNVGDVVTKGEVVAVIGEADHRGRNFYFELRIKGKPVNPLKFFAKRPATA